MFRGQEWTLQELHQQRREAYQQLRRLTEHSPQLIHHAAAVLNQTNSQPPPWYCSGYRFIKKHPYALFAIFVLYVLFLRLKKYQSTQSTATFAEDLIEDHPPPQNSNFQLSEQVEKKPSSGTTTVQSSPKEIKTRPFVETDSSSTRQGRCINVDVETKRLDFFVATGVQSNQVAQVFQSMATPLKNKSKVTVTSSAPPDSSAEHVRIFTVHAQKNFPHSPLRPNAQPPEPSHPTLQ